MRHSRSESTAMLILRKSMVGFGALATLGATACHRPPTAKDAAFRPAQVGDMMAAYAMPSLKGDTVRIAAGEPVTLLNVWATWCTSCHEEMGDLTTLQHDFSARGLRVVAVSVDQSDDANVLRYVQQEHLDFTVVHDREGTIESQYSVVGVPTSYLVGHDGKLLWEHVGNIADVLPDLRAAVSRALATPAG